MKDTNLEKAAGHRDWRVRLKADTTSDYPAKAGLHAERKRADLKVGPYQLFVLFAFFALFVVKGG